MYQNASHIQVITVYMCHACFQADAVPADLVGGWPSSPAINRPWTTSRSALQLD